jgi:hypothetical protein
MAARLALLLVLRCSEAWHATPRGRYALPMRATSDDLAALRVPDLKDQCRALGLPVSGTKAVLIERILEADGAPAATADAADAAAASIDDAGVEHPAELEATAPLAPKAGFRAGFVGVVGSPNVGKSTITNALLGEDLCVTTSKAQTTRHRILGVVTCVEIKILRRVRVILHAIYATPARWRDDAGSSPLDRARTAAPSPRNDLVKNCRVHPSTG